MPLEFRLFRVLNNRRRVINRPRVDLAGISDASPKDSEDSTHPQRLKEASGLSLRQYFSLPSQTSFLPIGVSHDHQLTLLCFVTAETEDRTPEAPRGGEVTVRTRVIRNATCTAQQKLTIVGTLEKNKAYIPRAMTRFRTREELSVTQLYKKRMDKVQDIRVCNSRNEKKDKEVEKIVLCCRTVDEERNKKMDVTLTGFAMNFEEFSKHGNLSDNIASFAQQSAETACYGLRLFGSGEGVCHSD
ncbi:hypothetical protein WH47_11045 [Habropoda laboriosa]|uniref:Uncharacterized protein n=1 Tax=Habropoda laboriosa TaxID=597456 RepID=A0A0L7QLM5_9HYME|nr:hypothetical protein WH47_11045 [Habropoda laboriosa]